LTGKRGSPKRRNGSGAAEAETQKDRQRQSYNSRARHLSRLFFSGHSSRISKLALALLKSSLPEFDQRSASETLETSGRSASIRPESSNAKPRAAPLALNPRSTPASSR